MSEQELARTSLRGIETTRSQITGKFKSGPEEGDDVVVKSEKIDAVDDFLSRLGNTEAEEAEETAEVDKIEAPVKEERNIRDIFANLTAEIEDEISDPEEEDILKPEISYQDIEPEKEEESPVDIYARDEVVTEADTLADDPFLQKISNSVIEPVVKQKVEQKPVFKAGRGSTSLIVQEKDDNIAVSFASGGKNIVSLKMPILSIPDGYPVSASLAPDIGLLISYSRGKKSVLTVVLEQGNEQVKTEIIGGSPSVRKISFGGMEFEVFAGAEVEAGMFSVTVEEDRLVYKY